MLHLETVEPHTFSLLKELMELPILANFSLVGGTALSLMYGHRISVDLDLFSNTPFKNEEIVTELINTFKDRFVMDDRAKVFGIFCFIDNVKVDIVRHPHPMIKKVNTVDTIRLFSAEDILAMKVQAILGRGKKKDFWDIAELLKHYTVDDFINFHKEKYTTQNLLISVPQAITYFSEADESEDPISLKKQTWEKIQEDISKKVSEYLK